MHPWSQYCLVPSRGMQEDGRGGKEVEKEERERKVGVGGPQQLENGLGIVFVYWNIPKRF